MSGLTAAYLLQRTHHVTLSRPTTGSAATPTPTTSRSRDRASAAVDSGFIVLNDRTYPLLRRLFAELGVGPGRPR